MNYFLNQVITKINYKHPLIELFQYNKISVFTGLIKIIKIKVKMYVLRERDLYSFIREKVVQFRV